MHPLNLIRFVPAEGSDLVTEGLAHFIVGCLITIGACAAWAQGTPPPAPEVLRVPGHHWSITLPEGWSVAPAEMTEAVNAEVISRMPTQNVRYVAALVPDAKDGPYVMIQTLPLPPEGADYEQIERSFDASTMDHTRESVKRSMGDMLTDFTMDRPVLDRATNRFIMSNAITGSDGKILRNTSMGMLGEEAIVMIHFYASEDIFAARAPEFVAITEGFRHDPGHEFVSKTAGGMDWAKVLRQGAIGGLIGALAGGAMYLYRKSKPAA